MHVSWVGKGDALGSGSWGSVLYLFFEKETVGDQGMLSLFNDFSRNFKCKMMIRWGVCLTHGLGNKCWCLENIFS